MIFLLFCRSITEGMTRVASLASSMENESFSHRNINPVIVCLGSIFKRLLIFLSLIAMMDYKGTTKVGNNKNLTSMKECIGDESLMRE